MTQITVEKTAEDSASRSLRVTVPVDRVREAEAKAVKYYVQRARLPGFRPGKAPAAVVRKRFGDAIRQSVLEEVIRESWETAQSTESLKPVSDPSIRNLKFEEGSPIEFDLLVEVRPEIKLERTGGFRIERRVAPCPTARSTSSWRGCRRRRPPGSPWKAAGRRLARRSGSRWPRSRRAAPGRRSRTIWYWARTGHPELEERIMTLLPGEQTDAEVRFPDDHPDESRRGQTRRVRVTLHDVKRQELPALDDALAREVGDFENLDALRGAVRQDLEREAAREADAEVRQALIQQIVEANGVQAPESLVHRLMHGYAEMYGVSQDQLPQFEQQFHQIAEAQVRRDLVLDAVVEANSLRATESELDQRVGELAAARGVPAGQLYANLQKANRLRELERAITEEKAFARLLQQSTIDEATS